MNIFKRRKTVVITALFMNNFSGSVFVVSEFATYFANIGYKVYILTYHKKQDVVRVMCKNMHIHVINLKKRHKVPKIKADLFIGLHHHVFDFVMASQRITCKKIVYFSLSPYLDEEKIPDNHNAFTKIYCNSWETAQIRSQENPDCKFNVFNNSVTPEFLKNCKKSYNKELHKIAIVSNHNLFLPESEFHKLAQSQGLDITFFGVSGIYKKIEPDDLLKFDAIISIGRTVQYGLALGIPVFCYDRFGGPGYITLDNWKQMEKMNYSGRMKPIRNLDFQQSLIQNSNPKAIIRDLIDNYSKVLKDVKDLRQIALERYDLYKNLDIMMRDIGEADYEK